MLPKKWLKPKYAKANFAQEAWWYGEERGVWVVVQTLDGTAPQVSAHIPKHMLLKWADDVRKRAPRVP